MPPYVYEFPRPAVTVDCIISSFDGERMWVLLIERKKDPYASCWAFPGGFIEIDEPLETAAQRELLEETGLRVADLEQFRAYGAPGRDPRGRTVAVVFYGFCPWEKRQVRGGDDAKNAAWYPWDRVPPLAFDHDQILTDFCRFLRLKAQVAPVGRHLLPKNFTLSQLHQLYQAIMGEETTAAYLCQLIKKAGLLLPASGDNSTCKRGNGLFRFDLRRYRLLERVGLHRNESGRPLRDSCGKKLRRPAGRKQAPPS